jgi:hypothetical protein
LGKGYALLAQSDRTAAQLILSGFIPHVPSPEKKFSEESKTMGNSMLANGIFSQRCLGGF